MVRSRQRRLVRETLNDFINEAFRVIAYGKVGSMKGDDALDVLWELLVNIDYEVKRSRCSRIKALMN
ncbi:hypothetical protein [Vulcanisaeta distributa]|uniref:hypothetical protein n=1 Tax=Vulcanisaeta distributa TaxID=164451 RepID=UPI000AD2F63E|nr:hypothetical protein [Vulcanisaeta distributa]